MTQEPLPAGGGAGGGCSLRETRVPQVACSLPLTHTLIVQAASISWFLSSRPVEVNSDTDTDPKNHASQKPLDKGCQKGQRLASCLGVVLKGLHSKGSPSSGSQKAEPAVCLPLSA